MARLDEVSFTESVKFLVFLVANFSIIKRFKQEDKLLRSQLKKSLENHHFGLVNL